MKGCLRLSSLPAHQHLHCDKRKCVAFCPEGSEEIYPADEWDRTPTAAQKLTYQDILELKEIQQSLPIAPQTPDPLCSRPYTEYLRAIPIGLVPLVPETYSCRPGNSPTGKTSAASPPSPPETTLHPSSFNARPPPSPWQPVQTSPVNRRPKPHFAFLPLLETPSTTVYPSPMHHSPASSPPSSPRTFAEFEASLESGEDKVLHHVPPTQLDNPSATEPDSLFRLPPRIVSPVVEEVEEPDSYFPPTPRGGHNKDDRKASKEQVTTSPALVAPPPLALIQPVSLPPPIIGGNIPAEVGGDSEKEKEKEKAKAKAKDTATSSSPKVTLPRKPNQSSSSEVTARPPPFGSKDMTPYFSFERNRTLSPPPMTRSTQTKSSNTGRPRELRSPSPILVPYCVSMARRSSPCSSPVIVPLGG